MTDQDSNLAAMMDPITPAAGAGALLERFPLVSQTGSGLSSADNFDPANAVQAPCDVAVATRKTVAAAEALYEASVIRYRDKAVGTRAACDAADDNTKNYHDCFVRDLVPSALYALAKGDDALVRNFLLTVTALPASSSSRRSRVGNGST